MKQKTPSLTDKHVASRIHLRRRQLGISQEELAQALNITFQQVQKYEKGINRISAGRLLEIANALSVPPQYFYENWAEASSLDMEEALKLSEFMASPEILGLIQALAGFRSPKVRQSMRDLAVAISDEIAKRGPAVEGLTHQSGPDK